jgi:transposase-like protein
MSSKRRFRREFKLTAVRRIQAGEPVARLARELEVNPGELYRWCREQEKFGTGAFMGSGHKQAAADRVAELERKIGQQTLEIDFLKRALQRVEGQRQLRALAGGARSTNKSNGKSQRDGI